MKKKLGILSDTTGKTMLKAFQKAVSDAKKGKKLLTPKDCLRLFGFNPFYLGEDYIKTKDKK